MKAIIISLICRTLAFIAVLAFVFGICFFTNNLHFLWLLFLILTVEFIPVFTFKRVSSVSNEDEDDEDYTV